MQSIEENKNLLLNKKHNINISLQKDLLAPKFGTHDEIALRIKNIFTKIGGDKQLMQTFLNLRNSETGMTLLHALIIGDVNGFPTHFWLGKYLIQLGLDPNLPDKLGNTALHTCVKAFEKDMLDRQRYTNEPDKAVLVKSHFESTLESMSMLIAGGANPKIENGIGEAPFQYLARIINEIGIDSKLVKKMHPTMKTLSQTYIRLIDEVAKGTDILPFGTSKDNYKEILLKRDGLENFEKYSHIKILDFGPNQPESSCIVM